MHMVHIKQEYLSNKTAAETDESGYAVIGVFFKTSWHYHRTLGKVSKMVKKISKSGEINKKFETEEKISKLVSLEKINWDNYYHYMGGFTTPNCNEVANWILIRDPLEISDSKVVIFFS